jgi:nucleotide-binding universal stress UspA family protein
VPVDISEASFAALRHAIGLPRTLKATLDVLHVVEAVAYAPMVGLTVDLERLREERERGARHSIVDEAQRRGSDLIIMAT